MSNDPGELSEPVMDGSNDDMSAGGTSKNDASDLQQAGRDTEITPPGSLGTGGLQEDPLANSERDDDNDHTGA